ncbi:Sulphatase-modifying factor protein [Thiorhodococcus drewsii AZ1]|uniref:Sulphatase-modifying factor protein n=2 Tax=Thiorhodococcus drewsii TaxID=210408 RepID=G2E5P8_9GAMM|nr:Sulphatase-modifying factor protein [Thiorhodococcus drewsii AZ1]
MAAHGAKVLADMQENWTAEDHPPLDACLEHVRRADVLVVILAHRFGWVPEDANRNPDGKSITWLECEEAVKHGKDVLAFVLDDSADWPENQKDEADLKRALTLEDDAAAERVLKATRQCIKGLSAFNAWLNSRGLRRTFRTKEDLKLEVERALKTWQERQATAVRVPSTMNAGPPPIPVSYLDWLRRQYECIELLGLEAQTQHPTHLSQVYVPAITPPRREEQAGPPSRKEEERARFELLLARVADESLYVPGDPGAGKSTFCRWLTLVTASEALPEHPITAPDSYRESYPESLRGRLPVLVPLCDFWPSMPLAADVRHLAPATLIDTLGHWLAERSCGRLPVEDLSALMDTGRCLLIFDGVDEVPVVSSAPAHRTCPRACLLDALSSGRETWTRLGNRLLLTSRPYGLRPEDAQRLGLPDAPLAELDDDLQQLFIRRWYAAADPQQGMEKADGLVEHLAGRPDLAELKRNPMLLTALCVRYGEGRRLPQDRHDLYDKIVNNVLFNRYRDADHERAAVRGRLGAIALGMHTGSSIQRRRSAPEAAVTLEEVERILADYAEVNPATEAGSTAAAQRRDELLAHSGLLLGRSGGKAGFYHLSFQEFLAAEHLARTRREHDWFESLVAVRSSVSEWRLTLCFLFGRMLERNGEQWALESAKALLATQNRAAVRTNPAPAVLCADWIEILVRKALNLLDLRERYTHLALSAIEDEIPLQDRHRLGLILGLVGDPRLGDLRDPDWRAQGAIEVPAGRYADQNGHQEIAQPFWLGRYPVTNSQYRLFIEDSGYQDQRWWSDDGWQWKGREGVSEPRYWRNGRLNGPNQPVVGVSFWEADACCRWAGGRLPTAREWEAAARGAEGHAYPWGEAWEDGICNTIESKLGITSPVGLFPRARQRELGFEDLAGNVVEWCQDSASSDLGGIRVLRGGSWYLDQDLARAVYRNVNLPGYRSGGIGFRVLWCSPIR